MHFIYFFGGRGACLFKFVVCGQHILYQNKPNMTAKSAVVVLKAQWGSFAKAFYGGQRFRSLLFPYTKDPAADRTTSGKRRKHRRSQGPLNSRHCLLKPPPPRVQTGPRPRKAWGGGRSGSPGRCWLQSSGQEPQELALAAGAPLPLAGPGPTMAPLVRARAPLLGADEAVRERPTDQPTGRLLDVELPGGVLAIELESRARAPAQTRRGGADVSQAPPQFPRQQGLLNGLEPTWRCWGSGGVASTLRCGVLGLLSLYENQKTAS